MPLYRVTSPGFYAGVFRTPGGRHDPVETPMPIPTAQLPSWLEPIAGEAPVVVDEEMTPQQRAARTRAANKAAKEIDDTEKKLDFSGNAASDGVETL